MIFNFSKYFGSDCKHFGNDSKLFGSDSKQFGNDSYLFAIFSKLFGNDSNFWGIDFMTCCDMILHDSKLFGFQNDWNSQRWHYDDDED